MPLTQMFGFKTFVPLPRPLSPALPFHNLNFCPIKPKTPKQFSLHSQNNNLPNPEYDTSIKNGGGFNGRSRLNLNWADLVLDPDPNNMVAVGLIGILALTVVQVLWQLLVISFAILATALKYAVVAALLVFILITLL
ncbi:uncharacterized protein LOC105179690 [Olea europaea subsp. europaea]|uniref:Uncharacterized protein LOC105179690 n=1 Tax=Olea europaea subsp. europaea TaxID=158383 RepID=A0A8S0UGM0_OLEEU|nr:uncharacterized protein LOC105179690 [Olea europaea subsp. europaea]